MVKIGIYKPDTLDELTDILLYLNKYDFYWYGDKETYKLTDCDLSRSKYIVISNNSDKDSSEDSSKQIYNFPSSFDYEDAHRLTKEYFEDKKFKHIIIKEFYNDILKFKTYIKNCIFVDYNNPKELVYENNVMKVLKFDDFDNLEYRKGSIEFGGILTKLLEFLRLYKNIGEEIIFKIKDFEKKSNIKIDEIKKLISSKEDGKNLFDFIITIDKDELKITNFNKIGKNRPFESNNN